MVKRIIVAVWVTGVFLVLAAGALVEITRVSDARDHVSSRMDAVVAATSRYPAFTAEEIVHEYLRTNVALPHEVLAGVMADGTMVRMEHTGASLTDETVLALALGSSAHDYLVGSHVTVEDEYGTSAQVAVVLDTREQVQDNRRLLGIFTLLAAVICGAVSTVSAMAREPRVQSRYAHTQPK